MFNISAEKISLWKEKQLLKGGDNLSLNLLVDLLGGLSIKELNLHKIKSEKKVKLKIHLDQLESFWNRHIDTGIPIQFLS